MRESLLVDERNLLEVCAVAVRTAQVCAGNETELGGLLLLTTFFGPYPHRFSAQSNVEAL